MKVCPICKAENEDQYIYCVRCHKPLPKQSRLDNLMTNGIHALEKGEYREAIKQFDEVLKLNIGNKDAWFLKGIALMLTYDARGARDCFANAGVETMGGRCQRCGGIGKCGECGGTLECYMCRGSGRCSMCRGSGKCTRCGHQDHPDPNCPVCHGSWECQRCHGSGECIECHGTGNCPYCLNGVCGFCGGTGKALHIKVPTVPAHLRRFIPK